MAAKGKKALIQILATKHNLPLKEVEKIINSQFKLAATTMSEGKFETIRLPLFGIFTVKPGRLKYLNDAKRKSIKNNRQSKD
jgi:nucleoid DNA-binding protein